MGGSGHAAPRFLGRIHDPLVVQLPERVRHEHYSRQAVPDEMMVPEVY